MKKGGRRVQTLAHLIMKEKEGRVLVFNYGGEGAQILVCHLIFWEKKDLGQNL